MRKISKIILHCSDSDNPAHDDISVIRDWHVNERGWSDVGYHYFITSKGDIQKGRDERTPGAHCYGQNAYSIGICLHGIDQFTEIQFRMLAKLIKHLLKENESIIEVSGHYKYSDYKTCPNFDVDDFLLNYDIQV